MSFDMMRTRPPGALLMHRSRLELACVLFMMTTVTLVSGCGGGHATHQALKDGWHAYGDAQTVDPVSVEVTDLEAWRGDEVMLEGWVGEVCAKKGCWMRIQDDQGDSVMVRFKDYGFFVPRNARGRRSVIHGTPVVKTLSIAQRRHILEDAGADAADIAAIDAPSTQVMVYADGVWIQGSGLAPPYAPAAPEDCIVDDAPTASTPAKVNDQ
ncbi:MAG: DUF4920 domain-containing protein [Phycisphaera sp. TMED9]|nr:MAG: DUF4920 domain-containing protein [Phycisphaera sp. TMED9]